MANGKGLILQIAGGVEKSLIQGLATLRAQIQGLADVSKRGGDISKLTKSFNEIGTSLDKMVNDAQGSFNELVKFANKYYSELAGAGAKAASGMTASANDIVDAHGRVIKSTKDVAESHDELEKIPTLYDKIKAEAENFSKVLKEKELQKYTNQIILLYENLTKLKQIDPSIQSIEQFARGLDEVSIAALEAKGAIKATSEGFKPLTTEGQKALGLTDKQIEALQKQAKANRLFNKTLRELEEDYRQGNEASLEYQAALHNLGMQIGKVDSKANTYIPTLMKVKKAMEELRTKAIAMGKTDLVPDLDKLKPELVVLDILQGKLKLVGNQFEILDDKGQNAFKKSSIEVKEFTGVLKKSEIAAEKSFQALSKQAQKVAEDINYADIEAQEFQRQLGLLSDRFVELRNQDVFTKSRDGLKKYKEDLKETTSEIKKMKAAIQTQVGSAEYDEIRSELNRLNFELEDHEKHLRDVEAQRKKNRLEAEKSAKQYKEVKQRLQELNNQDLSVFDKVELKRYNRELTKVENTLESLVRKNRISAQAVERFRKEIDEGRRSVRKYREALAPVENIMDRIAKRIKSFGAFVVAAYAINVLQDAMREAVRTMADFDQALNTFRAVLEATINQAELLGQKVIEIAQTTLYGAKEVAEGFTLLGQAGFTASETWQSIKAIADLAVGTLEGFEKTIDLTTTTIRAFGLQAVEMTRVADVMANAINKSKLDVDKLNTAFNYIGAVGKQAGLALEEVTGTLMVLADRGVKASTMATGLRRFLLELANPSAKLSAALHSVGMNIDDINIKQNGYITVLKNLVPLMWDYEKNTVDVGKASEFFGKRASQVVSILGELAGTSGVLQKAINQTREQGAAADMAAKQLEGLSVKTSKLVNNIGALAIAIGEAGFTDLFKGLIEILTETVKGVTDFINAFPEASFFLSIAASITAVAVAITAVSTAAVISKAKLAGLAATMGAVFSGPFVTWAIVITSAVIALKEFIGYNQKLIEQLEKQANIIQVNIDTMDGWTKVLQRSAYEGTDSFLKSIERLRKESPELAKAIEDEIGQSMEELVDSSGDAEYAILNFEEALKNVRTKEFDKKIDVNIESLRKLNYEMELQTQKNHVYSGFTDRALSLVLPFMRSQEAIEELSVKAKAVLDEMGEDFFTWSKSVGLTTKQAEEKFEEWTNHLIETGEISEVEFQRIAAKFRALVEDDITFSVARLNKVISTLPETVQKTYSEMNSLEKFEFVGLVSSIEDSLVKFEEFVRTIEKDEKKVSEIVQAERNKRIEITAREFAYYQRELKERETNQLEYFNRIEDAYQRGMISVEEYEKKKTDISLREAKQRYLDELVYLNELESKGAGYEDAIRDQKRKTADAERDYFDKRKEKMDQTYKDELEAIEKSKIATNQAIEERLMKIKELVNEREITEEEGIKRIRILEEERLQEQLKNAKKHYEQIINDVNSTELQQLQAYQAIEQAEDALHQKRMDNIEADREERLAILEADADLTLAKKEAYQQYLDDELAMDLLMEDEKARMKIQSAEETEREKLRITQEAREDELQNELEMLQVSLQLAKEKEEEALHESQEAYKEAMAERIKIEQDIASKREEIDRNEIEEKREKYELEKELAEDVLELEKKRQEAQRKHLDAMGEMIGSIIKHREETKLMAQDVTTTYDILEERVKRLTEVYRENQRLAGIDVIGMKSLVQDTIRGELEELNKATAKIKQVAEIAKEAFSIEIDYTGMSLEEVISEFQELEQAHAETQEEIRNTQEEYAQERVAIEKETSDEILRIEQETADKIASIRETLNDKIKSIEERLFDIRLQGLSDEEKMAEYRKRITEEYFKYKEYLEQQDLERAKETLDEIADLSSNLSSNEEVTILQDLTKRYTEVAEKEIKIEEEKAKKEIEIAQRSADEKYRIAKKNVDDILRELKRLDGVETKSTHRIDVIEEIKRITQQYATGGFTHGPSHANGGTDINVEGGEFILPKKSTSKILTEWGSGALESLRQGIMPLTQIFKNGQNVLRSVPLHVPTDMSFGSGGHVPSLASIPNMGSLNLTIGNKEVGPVYAQQDVIKTLSNHVKKITRMRGN